jgi:hypothetical protein
MSWDDLSSLSADSTKPSGPPIAGPCTGLVARGKNNGRTRPGDQDIAFALGALQDASQADQRRIGGSGPEHRYQELCGCKDEIGGQFARRICSQIAVAP